jgi:hypothetical protein
MATTNQEAATIMPVRVLGQHQFIAPLPVFAAHRILALVAICAMAGQSKSW